MKLDWNSPSKEPPENGAYIGELLIGKVRHIKLIGYEDGIWLLGNPEAVLLGWSEFTEYKPLIEYETK